LSNDKKEVIVKLEDIINISNSSVSITVDCSDNIDCSAIRMNGIKLSDSSTASYFDVSSAIVSLSLDNYIITDDVSLNMEVTADNKKYNFQIYITNNTLN
jgi:hypothetical protein